MIYQEANGTGLMRSLEKSIWADSAVNSLMKKLVKPGNWIIIYMLLEKANCRKNFNRRNDDEDAQIFCVGNRYLFFADHDHRL